MNESSLQERVEPDTVLEESAVRYEIVEQGTERSKLKLVSTDGYAYVFKKQTSKTTYWQCSVRRTNLCCKASTSQRGDEFIPGSHPHIHPSDPGLTKKTKIYTDVKQSASKDPYKAAGHIVEEKMKTHIEENDFNLQNPMNLKRAANRCREKFRPPEPRDLQFAIDHKFLQDEEFFRGDLHVDVARHIMYASEAQLQVLESAKRWYLDGTFKVVADSFMQLFTIHAFVHKDDVMKQVPFLFVLMSRRQRKDYDAIFRHIQQLIPSHRVQSFVLDFEAATWRSLQDLFPMARIHGCSFHWGQAVMRKVAELGLKTTYYQRGYTYNYIRKVLSLPYLPASHIVPAFRMLQPGANTEPLSALMDYISHTWIDHSIWSVREWSVFRQPIWTNNDTEGWHHHFAARAGGIHLQFYKLVPLLRSEADMVSICMRLVQEQQMTRIQRDIYKKAQGRLYKLWDKYEQKAISTSSFLSAAGKLFVE